MTSRQRARQTLFAAVLGGAVAAQLFLFVPMTLYSGNRDEFLAGPGTVLVNYGRPALALVAMLALPAVLFGARVGRRYLLALAALGLLLWLQGNVLVWDYGLLDGRRLEWGLGDWRGWVDTSVWILVLAGALRCAERGAKALLILASLAFGIAALGTARAGLLPAVDRGDKIGGDSSAAAHQMSRFSRERNVLHIVADGLQTDVFRDILEQDPGGRLQAALEGFVYFEDHLGAFPFTHMSVPAIVSGQLYDNAQTRESFLDHALGPGAPSLLNAAAAAGFEVDLAVSAGLARMYARGAATHVYPLRSNHHAATADLATQDALVLFDLALFRVVPHFLKAWVYNDQLWLTQRLFKGDDFLNLNSFAHAEFLRSLSRRISADREAPVYKLMHLMISHLPMATTEDCRYAGHLLPTNRQNIQAQARCGLIEIVAVLERMKALGIYDSATIVLMADHGAWFPPVTYAPDPSATSSDQAIPARMVAKALPLFAVKPPGATGALRVSSAPSWIVDTPATVAAMAGIDAPLAGENALELASDAPRERRFHVYRHMRHDWQSLYLSPIQEFVVDGKALDGRSWKLRQVLHPAGRREPAPPP